ncbi:pseudouridine synthase [Persephonella sp.]
MRMRLNRFIARSGYCSRRKADVLIESGKVKVNGKVIKDFSYKVDTEKDIVEIDKKIIKLENRKTYIKLYKPRGYLSQLGTDRFGRKTLTDLFKEVGIKENVFPVGRLDYESEGLLLLTNDGDFANKVAHPRNKVRKKYVVKVKGRVNLEKFNRMRKGTFLEDGFIKPDEIKILKKGKNHTWLEITIHSGKKRIIRRFTKHFGYPVERLIRTEIGFIKLDNLKEKNWAYIDQEIINRMSKPK